MEPAGYVAELFTGIQGEGPWIGSPQLFVRLAGCGLGCPWCDTKEAWVAPQEFPDGRGGLHPNPVAPTALARLIEALDPDSRLPLALTGGEPLEQATFLDPLLESFEARGVSTHLETAGVHPEAMIGLLDRLAHVSMDWKLPSLGGPDHRQAHRRFLDLLGRWGGNQAVKLVIGPTTSSEEAKEAAQEVAVRAPKATLVLQPLGKPPFGLPGSGSQQRAVALAWELFAIHQNLRVLPQLHRLAGWP